MAETNEMSVALLRRNKMALVDALKANGWESLDYANMRAADMPKYIKWGHGLLDIRVAAVRKTTGVPYYFTISEWTDPEVAEEDKSKFLLRGLRLRAMSEDIVIAPSDYGSGSIAAATQGCENYKAFTLENDGVEDNATWKLPTKNQLQAIYRYRAEINAAFNAAISSNATLSTGMHWSGSAYDSNTYWSCNLLSGIWELKGSGTSYKIRYVQNLKA